MKELSILKLFTEKRDLFEQYYVYIKQMENLDGNVALLAKVIKEYYSRYPEHNYIGEDELHTVYDLLYPQHRERQMQLELISRLYKLDVSTDVMTDLLEQTMERYHAGIIVNKLIPVLEGKQYNVLPHMQGDVDAFIDIMKNPPRPSSSLEPVSMLPSELVEGKATLEGARWHLESLNSILGPLTMGTLGEIFAYVGGGKTSFGLAAIKSFAEYYKDTKETLIYACNEEADTRVAERLTSAFTGKAYWELFKEFEGRKEALDDMLAEMGWHRIKVIGGVGHITHVRKLLDEWGPVCMFIDQGAKVSTDFKLEGVKETRLLYNAFRDLSTEYKCGMCIIDQAIGVADNKQWLTLADIYESRVAVQGELDYAIGIGKLIEKQGRENFRYVNISKNKLKDGMTAKFTTYFDAERCVWRPI
jgi:hypothetical protein